MINKILIGKKLVPWGITLGELFMWGDKMALFNKLDKPIFLKEKSESTYYISKLKELYDKSPEGLKEKLEKEIKIATLGEIGEKKYSL